jgi:hypothetical protein
MTLKLALQATHLDGACLTERMRAAERASTDADGNLIHDWLVMHIWLARCDALRTAYQAVNDADFLEVAPGQTFDAYLKSYMPLFERIVPETLPLFGEYARMKEIYHWKKSGNAKNAAIDAEFLAHAQAAGLPISLEDLIYAMGPDGPYGKEAYMEVVHQVINAYRH